MGTRYLWVGGWRKGETFRERNALTVLFILCLAMAVQGFAPGGHPSYHQSPGIASTGARKVAPRLSGPAHLEQGKPPLFRPGNRLGPKQLKAVQRKGQLLLACLRRPPGREVELLRKKAGRRCP